MATAKDQPQAKTVPANVFRAYDIRGLVGSELSAGLVYDVGAALAYRARITQGEQDRPVFAVGRDGRLSGPELSAALARGLSDGGCDVVDIGQVPTPVVYFATHLLACGNGVAVTGSHNPPDYNGLKMVVGETTLSDEAIQELRQWIAAGRQVQTSPGSISQRDVTADYLKRIGEDVHLARPMRIVIDCGNGVTGNIAPQLFEQLGCEVTTLYGEVDGTFPGHHPDPSKPENLQELIATVAREKAELGLAFDGDGDRLGVVTPAGKIIWADRLMMLFARDVLARNPGARIIYDVKCSRNLEQVIRQAGGEPIMARTGHSLIKARMKETGAALAGEMSGHIFFRERWYGFDDGLYAGCRLLEYLSARQEPPEAVIDALPDSVNTPEINLPMAEGEAARIIDRMIELADFPDGKVTTIDGLRVDFANGFGLARASNTTPVMVLRFEGDTPQALASIMARFQGLLRAAGVKAELPQPAP